MSFVKKCLAFISDAKCNLYLIIYRQLYVILITNDFVHRTIILLTLFSQFLTDVKCLVPTYSKTKGFSMVKFNVFQLFPVSDIAHDYNI